MKPLKTGEVGVAREFFRGELKTLMDKQQVTTNPESFDYLVDLMLRYMESDSFFARTPDGKLEDNVLANLYAEYLRGSTEVKRLTLQRLGDICLLVSGFFSDSLNRKIVDIDYYQGMGGSAYWTLSHFSHAQVSSVFRELSVKFKPFSGLLGELSERSGLQSNGDLLRLYEKWLLTGNDRLRTLLSEHGLATPVVVDTKIRH